MALSSTVTASAPASSPAPILQPGQQLANGVYTIQNLLSKGGMGSIYLATDRQAFDRVVVIKAMIDYFDPTDPQQVQDAQQRFLTEAQTLAKLRHPAIPQIYSYFQDGSHNYIVMEYIEGHDLETGLTRTDPHTGVPITGTAYPQNQVLQWGIALCRVLEYLANRDPHPVIHHDIKPANLLLDSHSGDVRLVDFGTAKARLLMQAGGGVGLQKTSVYGTQGYAAPEQYRGESEPRSDVYALAATLYHLATDDNPGEHPFSFPKLSDLGAFGDLLGGALAHAVDQRPTAATLRQQFKRLHDGIGQWSIMTPNSLTVGNLPELVQWCLAHWDEARTWLYAELPQQIEMRWGDSQTAQTLRSTRDAQQNQDIALNIALRLLDPTLPPPQIAFYPPRADFGVVVPSDTKTQQVMVINQGPGYAEIQLVTPSWVTVNPQQVALRPGAATTVTVTLRLQAHHTLGTFNDVLTAQLQYHNAFRMPLTAQVVLRLPSGDEFTTIKELVDWCEANWNSAVQWLHQSDTSTSLHTQIKPFITDTLTLNHRPLSIYKGNVGKDLDAVLAVIDPHGFRATLPDLTVSPTTIDIRALHRSSQTLVLKNISRRHISVEVELPPWVSGDFMTTELSPGAERELRIHFNHSKIPLETPQADIFIRHESIDLIIVPIVGQIPLWQRLWFRTNSYFDR